MTGGLPVHRPGIAVIMRGPGFAALIDMDQHVVAGIRAAVDYANSGLCVRSAMFCNKRVVPEQTLKVLANGLPRGWTRLLLQRGPRLHVEVIQCVAQPLLPCAFPW